MVCIPVKPGLQMLANKRDWVNSVRVCKLLKGNIAVGRTEAYRTEMLSLLRNKTVEQCHDRIYTGYIDLITEGFWEDAVTGEEINFDKWAFGEPNGREVENCLSVWRYGKYNDDDCTQGFCTICDFENIPQMVLRGSCEASGIDFNYVLAFSEEQDGFYKFVGWKFNEIGFVAEKNRWELVDIRTKQVLAHTMTEKGSLPDYPIGIKTWTYFNGSCIDADGGDRRMNLNSCTQDQFLCSNGDCVMMEQRCDREVDCTDQSDERECSIVSLPEGYDREMPPSQKTSMNTKKPAEIIVQMTVFDISNVNEKMGSLTTGFVLDTYWIDDRLTYNFLKKNEKMNNIPQVNSTKNILEFEVWTPTLMFENTDGVLATTRIESDKSSTLRVQRKGPRQSNSVHILAFSEQFKGAENVLHKAGYYSVITLCELDFRYFPFDQQNCELTIYADKPSIEFIELMPKAEIVSRTFTELQNFDIRNITLKTRGNSLILGIEYQRNLLSIFMTTYLPTILLNIINLATNFFGDTFESFDTIMTTNLTSMMVLAALYISVYDSLPQSANLKNIDLWLLFNLLFAFVTVLIHTYIQYQRGHLEDDEEVLFISENGEERRRKTSSPGFMTTQQKIYWAQFTGKYVTAVGGLLIVTGYWAYGLIVNRAN